jgi:hypothetical protein
VHKTSSRSLPSPRTYADLPSWQHEHRRRLPCALRKRQVALKLRGRALVPARHNCPLQLERAARRSQHPNSNTVAVAQANLPDPISSTTFATKSARSRPLPHCSDSVCYRGLCRPTSPTSFRQGPRARGRRCKLGDMGCGKSRSGRRPLTNPSPLPTRALDI